MCTSNALKYHILIGSSVDVVSELVFISNNEDKYCTFACLCTNLFHYYFPLLFRLITEATLVPSMLISPLAFTMRAGGLAAVILVVQKQC